MATPKPKVPLKDRTRKIYQEAKRIVKNPIISAHALSLRTQRAMNLHTFEQICKTVQGKPAIAQLYLNALEKNPKFFIKIPSTSTISLGKWLGASYDVEQAKKMIQNALKGNSEEEPTYMRYGPFP
ncbi:MAG: hypothetical protein V1847_03475 [Candidatus Diapherotrites archaeon]